jgi:DNA-binding MarR family transcriptional regulator
MEKTKSEYYFQAFKKMKLAFINFAKTELKDLSLSPNEVEVLSALDQKCCGSDVAREFDVSKTLVSRSVSFLKDKGYIKTEQGEDKREKVLILTEKGKEVANRIAKMKADFFEKILKNFDEREMLVFEALLKLMVKNAYE